MRARGVKRKIKKYAVWLVFSLILVTAVVVWLDHFVLANARNEDCVSDRLYGWQHVLAEYQKEHDGKFPATLSDIGPQVTPWLNCHKTNIPYLYFPEQVQVAKGRMVVMCPRDAHGWLTKVSFGLAYDAGDWWLVRVNSDGMTELRTQIGKV